LAHTQANKLSNQEQIDNSGD